MLRFFNRFETEEIAVKKGRLNRNDYKLKLKRPLGNPVQNELNSSVVVQKTWL